MSNLDQTDAPIVSLDSEETNVNIILRSTSGTTYTVPKAYAMISDFLKNAFTNDSETVEADLNIDDYCLKIVVDYMNEYKGTEPKAPEPPLHQDFQKVVDDFCFTLTNKVCTEHKMKDLMNAVNYMAIPQFLFILGCKIASLIKGKPIGEIKTILLTEC
jgi:hypothetical protein